MLRHLRIHLSNLTLGSSGFTLAALLVAIGITSLALGLLGPVMFQALATERGWKEEVIATKELRHAGSWFASDASNASSSNLLDGGPAQNSLTLGWTGSEGTLNSVSYNLVGNTLVRTANGQPLELARHVTQVSFHLSEGALYFQMSVAGRQSIEKSSQLQTYARLLH